MRRLAEADGRAGGPSLWQERARKRGEVRPHDRRASLRSVPIARDVAVAEGDCGGRNG